MEETHCVTELPVPRQDYRICTPNRSTWAVVARNSSTPSTCGFHWKESSHRIWLAVPDI